MDDRSSEKLRSSSEPDANTGFQLDPPPTKSPDTPTISSAETPTIRYSEQNNC